MEQPSAIAVRLVTLAALSFFLSSIEYALPKPLPFLRLGIANLPLIFALRLFSFRSFMLLALLKFVGMGLISGTLGTYVALFSLSGTLAAALAMWASSRLGATAMSFVGISTLGAMASSLTQIALASATLFGSAIKYIAAPFLAVSLITGIALGLLAEAFVRTSRWYGSSQGAVPETLEHTYKPEAHSAKRPNAHPQKNPPPVKHHGNKLPQSRAARIAAQLLHPQATACLCIILGIACAFQKSLVMQFIFVLYFAALGIVSGIKIRALPALLTSLGIVVANLLAPFGKVLLHIGPLPITQQALEDGLHKALLFQALVMVSSFCIARSPQLPGKIGHLVSLSLATFQKMASFNTQTGGTGIIEKIDSTLFRLEATALESPPPLPPLRPYHLWALLVIAIVPVTLVVLDFLQQATL